MARLTWDYLPLEGNTHDKQQGLNAPLVRFKLEAPGHVGLENPDRVKRATEMAYRGPAQQALNGFRQNHNLGVVSQTSGRRMLPDGTMIEYLNYGGQEIITLHIPASAFVSSVSLDFDIPCMLVLFDGNRFAAVPMGSIQTPVIIYKGKSRYGWGDTVKTFQMKCNDGTIAVAQLNPTKSKLQGAGFTVFATTKVDAFLNKVEAGSITELVAACTQSKLYVGGGEFTNSKAKVYGDAGSLDGEPYTVDSNGEYAYGLEIASSYMYGGPVSYTSKTGALTGAQNADFRAALDAINSPLRETAWIRYGVNDTTKHNIAVFNNDSKSMENSDITLSVPYQVGDKTSVGSKMMNIPGEEVTNEAGSKNDHMTFTLFGTTITVGDPEGGYQKDGAGYIFSFPPGLSTQRGYWQQEKPDHMIHTPYEDVGGDKFEGWLHVSNGEHLLQGYSIDDTMRLYLDEDAYLETIKGKLQASKINSILLDIPLHVIKAFG